MGPETFRNFYFSCRQRKILYDLAVVTTYRWESRSRGAAVALLALAFFGCSGSSDHPSSKRDGGFDAAGDRAASSDRPKADAAQPDGGGCGAHGATNDNGLSCSCAAECKSNFCVDGVCCDKACQGTCMTCALPT